MKKVNDNFSVSDSAELSRTPVSPKRKPTIRELERRVLRATLVRFDELVQKIGLPLMKRAAPTHAASEFVNAAAALAARRKHGN